MKLQSEAKEKLQTLEEPKFRYGIGIMFPVQLDYQIKSTQNIQISSDKEIVEKSIGDLSEEQIKLLERNYPISNKIDAVHFSQMNNLKLVELNEQMCKIEINENENTNLHLVLIAKKNTTNTIEFISNSQNNQFIESITLALEQDSNVKFTSITNHERVKYFSTKVFEIEKGAELEFNDIILNSSLNKSKIVSKLVGENSKSQINTINYSSNGDKSDIEVISHHQAKNTNSNINSKVILDNKSKSIYRSNIIVDKECSDIKGHQLAKALLLDKESKIDAVPMLEVNNEKVEISHGVSISDIDKEELFYLQSRGISKEASRNMIINGFIQQELDKLSEETREKIDSKLK